ncbi:gustatory receptor for sugar taste 64c-like [Musca domestica]|uniref:Gustatory receptor n=1 Tax=Musca domestica TaxID=7370 RepID=A0ABM3UQL9_MUSDO|nr:gustatory receptor for sugar taste 64c-like [Musca domestica]
MVQVKVQSYEEQSTRSITNTLHHALGPFLVLSRFFGTMPVLGVWPRADIALVRFKWCSLPVLVTLTLCLFATMDLFLSLKVVTEMGIMLTTTGPLSFSIGCLTGFIVFLWLSRKWPNLIKSTRRLEVIFLRGPYAACPESQMLSRRIRLTGTLFLVSSVVEHLCYVGSGIYSNHLQIKECNLTAGFWKNYYMRERWQFFSLIDYTVWLVPLLQWITISMTFIWNFVDIFLILVSQSLAVRFNQFKWHVQCHQKKHMSNDFWLGVRKDFLALTDLLWLYDTDLSGLVMLSCAQNLYFLAVQTFHVFLYRDNFMSEIYFWFSLLHVAIRTFYMMWSAAAINETAYGILSTIYEIPTAYWCLELKRLNEIIISDLIALSGKGFFFLTRRLMLAMAGTLVIYELVLLDQVDGNDVHTPLCNQRKG